MLNWYSMPSPSWRSSWDSISTKRLRWKRNWIETKRYFRGTHVHVIWWIAIQCSNLCWPASPVPYDHPEVPGSCVVDDLRNHIQITILSDYRLLLLPAVKYYWQLGFKESPPPAWSCFLVRPLTKRVRPREIPNWKPWTGVPLDTWDVWILTYIGVSLLVCRNRLCYIPHWKKA